MGNTPTNTPKLEDEYLSLHPQIDQQTEEQLNSLAKMDPTGNGLITSAEILRRIQFKNEQEIQFTRAFLKGLELKNSPSSEIHPLKLLMAIKSFKASKNTPDKMRVVFEFVDSDRDSFVSKSDVKTAFNFVKSEFLSDKDVDEIINEIFNYADKDRDNQLSFQKFLVFMNCLIN